MWCYDNGDPTRAELGHLNELIMVRSKKPLKKVTSKVIKVGWAGKCVWSQLGCHGNPETGQCQ